MRRLTPRMGFIGARWSITVTTRSAGKSRRSPSGRRMSWPCSMVSLSICQGRVAGGVRSEPRMLRKAASRVSGVRVRPRRLASTSSMRFMRKPLRARASISAGPLASTPATRWATTSRTAHPAHSDGVAHCSGRSLSRSASSACRSSRTEPQTSMQATSFIGVPPFALPRPPRVMTRASMHRDRQGWYRARRSAAGLPECGRP